MLTQRTPKGKALVLVLVLIAIERYVFNGAINGVIRLLPEINESLSGKSIHDLIRLVLLYCIGRLFYPLCGFLADIYFGRYKMIYISLWLYWVAYAILALEGVLPLHRDIVIITIVISYVCIILASGGFQATIIPFGADQLIGASSSELSSYFYWYYFAVQVGTAVNLLVDSGISFLPKLVSLSQHMNLSNGILQSLIATTVISLALILHKFFEHWYFKKSLRENCIKSIAEVLWYAATARRHMPRFRRAFRYGEGRIPRIELAKSKYDGKYSEDRVEEVKTFCRMLFIIFSFGGFLFAMTGVSLF